MSRKQFEIVVVGGGHAGIEAALVAARRGAKTALITLSAETIGEMSCNPAIGGLGKGQLVKEVDALFGEMGRAIDETGIQFRTLNSSKGAAVRSSRAQADRLKYRQRMRQAVESCPGLTVIEGEVSALVSAGERAAGVVVEGPGELQARAVVLTTGTFLRGLLHTGECMTRGGRTGERASEKLSSSLLALGVELGRMKTGTPPRLQRRSINYAVLKEQPGDTPIKPFSLRTAEIDRLQTPCWITHTNEVTHAIIAANRDRSPLFNGQISSRGPRYCPSIEDKVYRFAQRTSHHIFLEPEGSDSELIYPNGIATSLPADVQDALVRSIKGLEQAEIVRYGYAVEYDFVPPTQLDRSLQVKHLPGLFLAGQINGTSGYEEAAGQGIVAGINAVNFVRDEEPWTPGRNEAYVGVMIDDLVTLGVVEPYRMFTSRAEHRLYLREDNADVRLTTKARELGLVNDSDWRAFNERQERIAGEKKRLKTCRLKPAAETNQWLSALSTAPVTDSVSLAGLLRRPDVSYGAIVEKYPPAHVLENREAERVEIEIKFEGYLLRQQEAIERMKKMENIRIPRHFKYEEVKGLSVEVRERLLHVQPETLGQASRISGVTAAALSLLAIYIRREKSARTSSCNSQVA